MINSKELVITRGWIQYFPIIQDCLTTVKPWKITMDNHHFMCILSCITRYACLSVARHRCSGRDDQDELPSTRWPISFNGKFNEISGFIGYSMTWVQWLIHGFDLQLLLLFKVRVSICWLVDCVVSCCLKVGSVCLKFSLLSRSIGSMCPTHFIVISCGKKTRSFDVS